MKFSACLLSAACGAFSLLAGASAQSNTSHPVSGKKPNIIVFLVDDMGWQDSSHPFWSDDRGNPKKTFLNKRYRTPNMEKLAAQGMTFTDAYAHPLCTPSRVSLMSGMNPARHRVTCWVREQNGTTDRNNKNLQPPDWALNGLQPVGIPARGTTKRPISGEDMHYNMTRPFVTAATLPEMLKKCGYVTVHCGKAHFGTQGTPGSNPLNMGFDYNIAGTEIGHPADYRGSKHYGKGFNHVRGLDENNYYQDDVFLTEALTLEALKRLEAIRTNPKEAGKPFYLYMAQYALHAPLDQRAYDKRFADFYKNPEDGHKWSPVEKHYSGLIEGMDKSLGDIMKYLKEHDMDKNTVLVFMSDNGGLAISGRLGNEDANYPLSFGKGSCMEGGIREPMIVSWPGVTKGGSRCAVPVVIDDFFPTLLDIAGCRNAKVPQKLDGLSLVPLLKGGRFPADRPLLFHQPNNWGENNRQAPQYGASTALRHGDWKLIYRHGNQSFELYNLKKDIGEKENLAAREPRKLKEMAGLMGKLLRERKAQMPTYKKGNELGAPEGSSVPWPDQVKKGGN